MGKPTGFMEYNRIEKKERPPLERIHDWNEFHVPISEEDQKNQASRCMECSIPYCHTCTVTNGLVSGCPLSNLIPDWNDMIFRGLWRQAYILLSQTNNFPEFTSRVCPAPCEGSCTAGLNGDPVTIRENEYAIIEKAFANGWVNTKPPLEFSGKHVAVVGSGPAGLACADTLNSLGHLVTVFERSDRFGGLLMYGIPNMKLDKTAIERRIDIMKLRGVKFVSDFEIGTDVDAGKLLARYDAVVLACGAAKARDISVPGRDAAGIYNAVSYLSANTKSILSKGTPPDGAMSAKNLDVVVIGGGDTGTDCVGTAIRQGCKSVIQLEIMPRPSDKRPDGNPWPLFPKVFKTDYGQTEAAALFGIDPRIFNTLTKAFSKNDSGQVTGLDTVLVEWKKQDNGNMAAVEIPGSEKHYKADLVLLAMGFLGAEGTIAKQLGIEMDVKTNIKAEYGNFMTNIKGVFAAGDMRRGQSLVVWAVNEGRCAAREVDRFLMDKNI